MNPRRLAAAASAALVALIFLCVAWELWLAPLRPAPATIWPPATMKSFVFLTLRLAHQPMAIMASMHRATPEMIHC